MTLLTFPEALSAAADVSNSTNFNVLLGNGFSIECRSNTFRYAALLEAADFSGLSVDANAVFGGFETYDFERIIEVLEASARLIAMYGDEAASLIERLRADAEIVRNGLAEAIAKKHPEAPTDLTDDEYRHAQRFLGNFDRVYTANYDLLLYWTIMHERDDGLVFPMNDGFSNPDEPDADYVAWERYRWTNQRIYYLHGGLHLFDFGHELRKFTWSRTGIRLVDQIRNALATQRYPLVVTEGSTLKKEEKIQHNSYLAYCLRSFASIQAPLFMHGVSMSPNDDHIFQRIRYGKTQAVFLSVHGDTESPGNRALVARVQQLADSRPEWRPALNVFVYDAATANVWGHDAPPPGMARLAARR